MSRSTSQYKTLTQPAQISPVWFLALLNVQELNAPEVVHSYYFTDAPETLSFFDENGAPEAYLPIGMEIEPVSVDQTQKVISFRVRLDNVSRELSVLAGTLKLTSGRCILMRGVREDLSEPDCAQVVFQGAIRSWVIGEQYIEIEIGSDIPLINKAPRRLFYARCQWKFKAVECGYTGEYQGFLEKWWLRDATNYNIMDLLAPPDLTRNSQVIDYTDANPLGQGDYFNCHIESTLVPLYTETYTIYTTANNGVRIWIDNVLVIDKWTNSTTSSYSSTVSLTADTPVSIVIQNFEQTDVHRLLLEWSSPSQAREKIGETAGTVKLTTDFETCDKTLNDCKLRYNTQRFGGFPHVARSRDPRTVWTKN